MWNPDGWTVDGRTFWRGKWWRWDGGWNGFWIQCEHPSSDALSEGLAALNAPRPALRDVHDQHLRRQARGVLASGLLPPPEPLDRHVFVQHAGPRLLRQEAGELQRTMEKIKQMADMIGRFDEDFWESGPSPDLAENRARLQKIKITIQTLRELAMALTFRVEELLRGGTDSDLGTLGL